MSMMIRTKTTATTQLLLSATALLVAAPLAAGPAYRDLNHNGRLDAYEDSHQSPEKRVADLLRQMTLEEKVGTMLHGTLPAIDSPMGASSKGYDLAGAEKRIRQGTITSFITRLDMPPVAFAEQNNAVQKIAEAGRLGIPLTISTDPRSHFQAVLGASSAGGSFSVWPETLGFAALGDTAVMRRFGMIVAREYRAVGITMALSPQADLASEPRWSRTAGTFGSDPATVSALAAAYIEGFQGSSTGLRPGGVATIVKHWVGYGAQPDGFDGHNYYGRFARLDNASMRLHVAAFHGAFKAGVAGVMPTYPIVEGVTINGKPVPPVGTGFSKPLLTDLLRGQEKYRGLVLSDWGITSDCTAPCRAPTVENPQKPWNIGMPWGVENMKPSDRFALGVNAGIDQFGGVDDPVPLLEAVRAGKISMDRIDAAVSRILLVKFRLGLFDNPYVDPAAARRIVGNLQSQAEADRVQRKAQVLLENRKAILPLAAGKKIWLKGIDGAAARAAGLVIVDDLSQADVALLRTATPSERLHPFNFFGAMQHEGRLDFLDGDPAYEAIKAAAAKVPTIVIVDMDRPAILTNIKDHTAALLVTFGANDAAVLDVVTGKAKPQGRMPFELPSSMTEVAAQNPAVPDDTAHPLYRRGAGIVSPK